MTEATEDRAYSVYLDKKIRVIEAETAAEVAAIPDEEMRRIIRSPAAAMAFADGLPLKDVLALL